MENNKFKQWLEEQKLSQRALSFKISVNPATIGKAYKGLPLRMHIVKKIIRFSKYKLKIEDFNIVSYSID